MLMPVLIREIVPDGSTPREEHVWEWNDVHRIEWLAPSAPLTIDRADDVIKDARGKVVATIHLDTLA